MPTEIHFQGESELLARIGKARQRIRWATQKALSTIGMRVTGRAKEKASGEVLHAKRGNLHRAIHTVQESMEQGTIRQLVGLSLARVPYARIHEYGGTTSAHEIRPKKGLALRWQGDSFTFSIKTGKSGWRDEGWIFAKVVHHPGSVMPERSYLRSSLAELAPWALDTIRGSILEALAK